MVPGWIDQCFSPWVFICCNENLSFLIICVGITTINHYLMGIQAIFTIDFYKNNIKNTASESEKIRFGKIIALLTGLFCGLIAISLEDTLFIRDEYNFSKLRFWRP